MRNRTAELVLGVILWVVCMSVTCAGFAVDAYLVYVVNGFESAWSQHAGLLLDLAILASVVYCVLHRLLRSRIRPVSIIWYVSVVGTAMLVVIPMVFFGEDARLLLCSDSPPSFRNPMRAGWHALFVPVAVCLLVYWVFRASYCISSWRSSGKKRGATRGEGAR